MVHISCFKYLGESFVGRVVDLVECFMFGVVFSFFRGCVWCLFVFMFGCVGVVREGGICLGGVWCDWVCRM